MPVEELRAVRKVANDAGVPVYLDGARMFNAARLRERRCGISPPKWTR